MKLLKIEIKNIALHENTVININKPLTVLFGDVEQGKTTVLNVVRWALGCVVPDNVIKEGCTEGEIFLTFDTSTSRRTFYKNKEGVEVARPLEYVENGKIIKEPIKYLKSKINPFLLDNEYFMKMTLTEQMKFFVALFGVDTSDENKLIATTEDANKTLRIEIKAIGEVVPVVVEKPRLEELLKEKENISDKNKEISTLYSDQQEQVSIRKMQRDKAISERERLLAEVQRLQALAEGEENWLCANPELPEVPTPLYFDITAVEAKISNAKADEVRYDQYMVEVKKLEAKQEKENALASGEAALKVAKAKKMDKLAGFSSKTGIDGLLFVDGGYTYQGTAFDMLSTSARMDLSDKLSALFPSDFSVDLIDRAESLGKRNLINLADLAAAGNRTIIATVVSDELSIDNENVGVFKVVDGNVE